MNLKKIRKDVEVSRNYIAVIMGYKPGKARWIEENIENNKTINYLEYNALIFNVTIDYILGISDFEELKKEERERLIEKLHIDENKLNEFQKSYLSIKYTKNLNIKNSHIRMEKLFVKITKENKK
jgi:transcriptional regulator with XRE-family HTH domain